MKKFIYAIVLAFVASASFISCTEEVVKPKADQQGGSGIKEF